MHRVVSSARPNTPMVLAAGPAKLPIAGRPSLTKLTHFSRADEAGNRPVLNSSFETLSRFGQLRA